jgi:O-antigen/teichoic acid export membrane protein
LGFVSQAISQVNLKKVAEIVHRHGNVTHYIQKISLFLTAFVTVPTVMIMIAAPQIFSFVFGQQWQVAGELLRIMMPAVALRFVVSTVSGTFASTGNNRLYSLWIFSALFTTFAMFFLLAPRLDFRSIFVAMTVTDVVLYGLYYYLILLAAKNPRGQN